MEILIAKMFNRGHPVFSTGLYVSIAYHYYVLKCNYNRFPSFFRIFIIGHLQTNITHLISYLIFSGVCVTHLVLDNHLSVLCRRAGRNYLFHVLKFFLRLK
ncbi:hypothetical protein SORBI_3009G128600 [Sorghum bicolor]|jgi:hypothetical protein|uniref:Uncharacterized protein n=1 Tax=Sorghum bicolor TaxID=4558 RepID=A0A1B6P8I0_SORBI|nr:hypothetical protein SORBI_3009G128600 [Sorghum bicolor]